MNHIGSPTLNLFKTMLNLMLLLAVMLIVYSAYSFASNIIDSDNASKTTATDSSSVIFNFLKISLGSKATNGGDNSLQYYISSWLGVGMLVFWIIMFFVFAQQDLKERDEVKNDSKTVSTYSIMIDNMPSGLSKAQLQKQFDDYY